MYLRRSLALPLAVTLIACSGCEKKNTAPPAGPVTPAARTLTLRGAVLVPTRVQSRFRTSGWRIAQAASPSPSPTPTPAAAPLLGPAGGGRSIKLVFIGPDGVLRGSPQTVLIGADGSFSSEVNVNDQDILLCLADLGRTSGGQTVQQSLLISVRNLELNPNQSQELTPGSTAVTVAEMALAAGKDGAAAADLLVGLANGTAVDMRVSLGLIALESSVSIETTQERETLQIDRAATVLDTIDTLEELDQLSEALGTALNNAVVRVLNKLDIAKETTLGKALALVREAFAEVLIASEGKLGSDKNIKGLEDALLAAGDKVAGDANALKRIQDDAAAELVDEVANASGPVDTTAPFVQASERPIPAVTESPSPAPSGVSGVSGTAGGGGLGPTNSVGGGGGGL